MWQAAATWPDVQRARLEDGINTGGGQLRDISVIVPRILVKVLVPGELQQQGTSHRDSSGRRHADGCYWLVDDASCLCRVDVHGDHHNVCPCPVSAQLTSKIWIRSNEARHGDISACNTYLAASTRLRWPSCSDPCVHGVAGVLCAHGRDSGPTHQRTERLYTPQ